MIKNSGQLEVVRQQLIRAETALESLRSELLPKNQQMYELISESYVEVIQSLRSEIDLYLGIAPALVASDLTISLEGPTVSLGHTSAAVVTRFIDAFRTGLQSAVEITENVERPKTARRRERWIENLCDLSIVGVAPGSIRVLLSHPNSKTLFNEDEKQTLQNAVEFLFTGLSWADTENIEKDHPFTSLTSEQRQSLLALVTRLLPPRSGDIDRVAFERNGIDSRQDSRRIVLTQASRDRIRQELESLHSTVEFVELTGVIRSVDLDSKTFILREREDGQPELTCEFSPDLDEGVKEFLDSRVVVAGTLETRPRSKKQLLLVDTIEFAAAEPGSDLWEMPPYGKEQRDIQIRDNDS